MFTVSDSFWSLNLNQKLLWLLPPFLLFNVCKHQYIKKNPEETSFGEKIKWPRIYIIMFTLDQYLPPPNTKLWTPLPHGHNFGRQYRLLKNAFYELISYDCKSTEKIFTFFFAFSLCGHIVDHTKRFGALTHGSWGSQLKKDGFMAS